MAGRRRLSPQRDHAPGRTLAAGGSRHDQLHTEDRGPAGLYQTLDRYAPRSQVAPASRNSPGLLRAVRGASFYQENSGTRCAEDRHEPKEVARKISDLVKSRSNKPLGFAPQFLTLSLLQRQA